MLDLMHYNQLAAYFAKVAIQTRELWEEFQ